jgi:hypothetical protein
VIRGRRVFALVVVSLRLRFFLLYLSIEGRELLNHSSCPSQSIEGDKMDKRSRKKIRKDYEFPVRELKIAKKVEHNQEVKMV